MRMNQWDAEFPLCPSGSRSAVVTVLRCSHPRRRQHVQADGRANDHSRRPPHSVCNFSQRHGALLLLLWDFACVQQPSMIEMTPQQFLILVCFSCLVFSAFSLSNIQNRRSTLRDTFSILLVTTNAPSYASDKNTQQQQLDASSQYLIPPNTPDIKIPRVGYSFYKTEASQVETCTYLALAAGVRHLDIASMYGTNEAIGSVISSYISTGYIPFINQTSYRPILAAPVVTTPRTRRNSIQEDEEEQRRSRRQGLFISHKLSNAEQSTDPNKVRQAILQQMKQLQVSYVDMVSIHSPLTDKHRRLTTYQELLRMQQDKQIGCIGVCNYGVGPLEELVKAGLPPPSVIQLELSPFNQHKDVISWGTQHGCIFSCAAWSKLSSIDGPQDGWAVLASIAKKHGVTKAQVLVRWALQKGYICVPRSGSGSKIERKAIFENSYNGVQQFQLSPLDMETLDGLDENLKAGKLGRRDGWDDSDVTDVNWDPTYLHK